MITGDEDVEGKLLFKFHFMTNPPAFPDRQAIASGYIELYKCTFGEDTAVCEKPAW
jgi:hypothetical protein